MVEPKEEPEVVQILHHNIMVYRVLDQPQTHKAVTLTIAQLMVDTHHGPAGTLVLLHVVAALRTEPDPVPILHHNMVDYNVQELHLVNSPATHIIVQLTVYGPVGVVGELVPYHVVVEVKTGLGLAQIQLPSMVVLTVLVSRQKHRAVIHNYA